MSIKNSCDTKVTGGICYDTSNNKGVCIRNDVRDFEKELEIYGTLSREKCQFTDPTTNTKKDMEFYYLTTVPSLDLSIKEKTPVQFKLNTPIPTPEPSVEVLFKFNNKKGIIGHVDNIGENIELSYLFVISNQREEEDRMDAENIVKGIIYGKLKVAPNSEYIFTKPKEGSPTILTPYRYN